MANPNDEGASTISASIQPLALDRLRRFHVNGPAYLAVHRWLAPISVYEGYQRYARSEDQAAADFEKIARLIEGAVQRDPRIAGVRDVIADYVTRELSDQHLALFSHAQRASSNLLKTYLSVVYARALHVLRNGWFGTDQAMPEIQRWVTGDWVDKTTAHLRERLDALGPYFIGLMVMEAEHRAVEDGDFRKRLDDAFRRFEAPRGQDVTRAMQESWQLRALAKESGTRLALYAHIAFAFTLWD